MTPRKLKNSNVHSESWQEQNSAQITQSLSIMNISLNIHIFWTFAVNFVHKESLLLKTY